MMKQALEYLLYRGGAAAAARAARRGRTLVIAYHNVVPDGAEVTGEGVLHLPLSVFRQQLDLLRETHDVVPLGDVLEADGSPSPRPRVVITFDDAYRGALTVGLEEIVRRDLPATVFVSPGFVGDRSFWWDAIEVRAGSDGRSEGADGGGGFRSVALTDLAGRDDRIRERAAEEGLEEHAVTALERCVSEDELREAAERPNVTLASHTWSHVNLTRLEGPELRRELERPLNWLRERYPDSTVPWVAYPYGFSSPRVQRAARAVGYEGAFRLTANEWLPADPEARWNLPRFSIPRGLSRWGFGLRMAGL